MINQLFEFQSEGELMEGIEGELMEALSASYKIPKHVIALLSARGLVSLYS